MKIISFSTNDEWLEGRRTRITGTRASEIAAKKNGERKIGFYELIAENLLREDIEPDEVSESALSRGHRLEPEAIEQFTALTGKEVDKSLVIWAREDDERIAVSPDGVVVNEPEVVECKCLSSANHVKVMLTEDYSDYEDQVLQYFVVRDDLTVVHLCFYDDRLKVKPFFVKTFTRAEMLPRIEATMIQQRQTLAEVSEIVEKLTSF